MLRIRQTAFEDAAAIASLNRRNGMGDIDPSAWRQRWEAHPFKTEFTDIPIGWVLETDDGSVAGSLENVHMLYEIGGRRIKGAVAAGWAVDAEHRGKSLQLLTTFLRQKGIDLTMVLSSSPTTAQLLTLMKVARIPIPDYATPCFWAVHPRAFAKAAFKGGRSPGRPRWRGLLVSRCSRGISYRGSGRGRELLSVRRLSEFDDRFDALWQKVNAGITRLRAVRTRAVLAWRFGTELHNGQAAIIVAERGGTLLGYAVLLRRQGGELGMDLCDVADLQAVGDDPTTTRDLLLGSIRIAREDGADALKFMSGTPAKRAPADALQPYTYHLPFWQMYYKAAAPELNADLATADAWDISLFDTY